MIDKHFIPIPITAVSCYLHHAISRGMYLKSVGTCKVNAKVQPPGLCEWVVPVPECGGEPILVCRGNRLYLGFTGKELLIVAGSLLEVFKGAGLYARFHQHLVHFIKNINDHVRIGDGIE